MKSIVLSDWHTSYQEGLKAILELLEIKSKIVTLPIIIHPSSISSLDEDEIELVLMDIAHIKEDELYKKLDLLNTKNIPVAILTMNPKNIDPLIITKYRNVKGLLSKRMETKELIRALEQILSGQRYIHADFGEIMFEHIHRTQINQ